MRFIGVYRWAGLCLLLLSILGLSSCSGGAMAATPQVVPTQPAVKSSNVIVAEGRVIPAQEATLSFISSGVIQEVLVHEGDRVEAGQVLARLTGNEQLEAAVASSGLDVLAAEQELKRLQDGLELERADAQLALTQARKELDKAQKRLYSKAYQRGDQDQVDIARANYVVAEDGVSKAEQLYDQVDDRSQDDPVRAEALSQLAAARQQRDVSLANMNYLLSKPNEMDVAEIDAQLAVAQAHLTEAERRLGMLQDGPDASQLALAQARLKSAQTNLDAARASLTNLELSAPFAGTVNDIQVAAGEFVSTGVAVARLSDPSAWLVETTDLIELNVARVWVGMPATVRFDALPDIELFARVVEIKAFGENRQGDIVYPVLLRIEQLDARMRWNMTASVSFIEKLDE